MSIKALIMGVAGQTVTSQEEAFLKEHNPWGFILFARNVDNPDQVKALITHLRTIVGREDAPILIDQEGGRVQRFRAPHWYNYPSAASVGQIYKADKSAGRRAAWIQGRLHAFDLLKVGVTVDCVPVLDVPTPDGHSVIGDRAYADDPHSVADLGNEVCKGIMAGGVMPVIKHIPGHGRGNADSHHELPVVNTDRATLEATDFAPFKQLNHIPMAMTAHIVYSAIDPEAPATTSRKVMDEIVRGYMGYEGLVMCDDITMSALSGDLSQRTQATFDAGCDIVLHCTGKMREMQEVAQAARPLSGLAEQRAAKALLGIGETDGSNESALRVEFDNLMSDINLAANNSEPVSRDPTNYGPTGVG